MLFDTVETPEKIEMPPGAAKLAIGDRLQADIFLLLDDTLDLAVLDFLELRGRNFAFGALLACFFQRCRTQQATDMVGAKRRFCSL